MRYVVIETAFLGDVIIALAIARVLKQLDPTSHVAYVVRPDAAKIAAASPDVDNVIVFDKRGQHHSAEGLRYIADKLNELKADAILCLHESKRTQRLLSMLACPIRVGWENLSNVLTHPIADAGWTNRYERALRLVECLHPGKVDSTTLPRLTPKHSDEIDAFANDHKSFYTIAPGSVWNTKRWLPERFIELSELILNRGHGVIVIGGQDALQVGEAIVQRAEAGSVLNLAGRAQILESAFAIQKSLCLVANDSAPTHLAVAVGTPVVTIFGPTVPAFGFAPPHHCGAVVENELWCRPCTSHGSNECPIHTHECMQSIEAPQVLLAIDQLRTSTHRGESLS